MSFSPSSSLSPTVFQMDSHFDMSFIEAECQNEQGEKYDNIEYRSFDGSVEECSSWCYEIIPSPPAVDGLVGISFADLSGYLVCKCHYDDGTTPLQTYAEVNAIGGSTVTLSNSAVGPPASVDNDGSLTLCYRRLVRKSIESNICCFFRCILTSFWLSYYNIGVDVCSIYLSYNVDVPNSIIITYHPIGKSF